jgi:hypothetical protein
MKKFMILVLAALMLIGACCAITSCSDSCERPVNCSECYFVDVSSRCVYAYIEIGAGKYATGGFITLYAADGTLLRYEGELPSTSAQFVNISSEQLGLLPANIVRVD